MLPTVSQGFERELKKSSLEWQIDFAINYSAAARIHYTIIGGGDFGSRIFGGTL